MICSQSIAHVQRARVLSQKVWILVPAESLMSCGTQASHLTSLLLVSLPRDGELLIKVSRTYFPGLLAESNECESCCKI